MVPYNSEIILLDRILKLEEINTRIKMLSEEKNNILNEIRLIVDSCEINDILRNRIMVVLDE